MLTLNIKLSYFSPEVFLSLVCPSYIRAGKKERKKKRKGDQIWPSEHSSMAGTWIGNPSYFAHVLACLEMIGGCGEEGLFMLSHFNVFGVYI